MTPATPIKIAILAMGGEGGGVLADWIVDLGEHNGYLAQTTSVPGVAQRTGATIYYVELFPQAQAEADGAAPVFALMPLPGDVDIVLASELMEAGRAVQRGLVTPERTTLIASTHRVYAIAEKSAPADGRVDSTELIAHALGAAQRFVRFDMAEAAERAGSVISAVLFGALAGTGTLPFSREQFEATITRGGVGVKASLSAFGGAMAQVQAGDAPIEAVAVVATRQPTSSHPAIGPLLARWDNFPAATQPLLLEGLRRLVDYQDPAYAALYLDRMDALRAAPGGNDPVLLTALARHLALWMSYEDTVRVADLKTRGSRFERVRNEVKAEAEQPLAIHEYMHPRLQEIAETLPAGLGRWLLGAGWPRRLVARFTQQGRVVRTSGLRGFALLSLVAGLKRWRRGSLRYALENARIEAWLAHVQRAAAQDPPLAVELIECQRLVRGYGDTFERGLQLYDTVIATLARAGTLPAATLRELRVAAQADEEGRQLQLALARLQLV